MSNAASEAAAGLVPGLAEELVRMMPDGGGPGDPLAADVAQAAGAVETPSSPTEPPAPVAQVEEEEPFELPAFSLIDEDDEDEEDELLPAAIVEDEDDEQLVDEYEDPDKLRARLAAAEKQARHYQAQAAEAKLGQWRKKYKDMYPLANVDEINATSRRSFEKAAIKSHNANYKLLAPHLDKLKSAWEQVHGDATSKARSEAAAAFGKPTAGPGVVPLEQSAQTEAIVQARKTGDLSKVIGALFRG